MSFILDALKKSENERQKQSGPALFEVKVAPPARRFPVWAIVVGVLLGVNLVVLIAVLLMRDRQDPAVQDVKARIAANARGAAANTGPGSGSTAPAPEPTTALAPGAAPTIPAGAYPAAPGADVTSGLASTAPAGGATLGSDGLPVATGTVQAAAPGSTGASTRFNPPLVEEDPADFEDTPARPRGAPINPADYMPATAGPPAQPSGMPQPSGYPMTAGNGPAAPPGRAGPSNVRTASAIPSRDDLMASGMGDLPPASLSLHVYDRNPAARFVFVNGTRAKEGDTLPNGLRVDEITPEGTVLSYRGSRFLVPIQ